MRQLVSDAMANTNWSVAYPVEAVPGINGQLPLGGKLVHSLSTALADAPIEAWSFEVRGDVVASLAEFEKLIEEATEIHSGEFVARANGIVVEPS